MFDEIKKSLQSILYERISSPFSGAFIFSWIIWNWKVLYFLFFFGKKEDFDNSLEFIQTNFINYYDNLLFPFLTAVFLIGVYPFLTTGSLWVWLKFKTWQRDIKHQIENQELLTLEKSIAIRLELKTQQNKLDQLLKEKDEQLSEQNIIIRENNKVIDDLKDRIKQKNVAKAIKTAKQGVPKTENKLLDKDFRRIYKYPLLKDNFEAVMDNVTRGMYFPVDFPTAVLTYLVSNNIVIQDNKDEDQYKFTELGKQFAAKFLEIANTSQKQMM